MNDPKEQRFYKRVPPSPDILQSSVDCSGMRRCSHGGAAFSVMLCIFVVAATAVLSGGTCSGPGDPSVPFAGDGQGTDGDGLTAEEVEETARYVVDDVDLSRVVYLGGYLFDDPDPTARPIGAGTYPKCGLGSIKHIQQFFQGMFTEAERIKCHGPFPADSLGPAQPNGYAYVRGGKSLTKRNWPADDLPSTCQKWLWGIDCSGYLEHCVWAGGLKPFTEQMGNADRQNKASTWNSKIPSEWDVVMVSIPGEPRQWHTGDITRFIEHTGMVVVSPPGPSENEPRVRIYNSLGSRKHECALNMDHEHGPILLNLNKLKHNKKSLWKKFQGVLRMVPKCALDPATGQYLGNEEPTAAIIQDLTRIVQDITAYQKIITDAIDDYKKTSNPNSLATAIDTFENLYCPAVQEMFCFKLRYGMATVVDPEKEANPILPYLATIEFPDGYRTCEWCE